MNYFYVARTGAHLVHTGSMCRGDNAAVAEHAAALGLTPLLVGPERGGETAFQNVRLMALAHARVQRGGPIEELADEVARAWSRDVEGVTLASEKARLEEFLTFYDAFTEGPASPEEEAPTGGSGAASIYSARSAASSVSRRSLLRHAALTTCFPVDMWPLARVRAYLQYAASAPVDKPREGPLASGAPRGLDVRHLRPWLERLAEADREEAPGGGRKRPRPSAEVQARIVFFFPTSRYQKARQWAVSGGSGDLRVHAHLVNPPKGRVELTRAREVHCPCVVFDGIHLVRAYGIRKGHHGAPRVVGESAEDDPRSERPVIHIPLSRVLYAGPRNPDLLPRARAWVNIRCVESPRDAVAYVASLEDAVHCQRDELQRLREVAARD